jgi:DNA-binding response OmpR family regulator
VRVVVAVADPATRFSLAVALLAAGHDVIDVEDGVAVLELFGDDGAPDVVIVDLDLPRLSGLDVLGELTDAARPVKVIVLARPSELELRLEARHRGAHAVLVKPVDAARAVEVVRDAALGPPSSPRSSAWARARKTGPERSLDAVDT